MRAEVVVDGIRFGEGPVWCPAGVGDPAFADTLVVTSVCDGALYRVWPEAGRSELLADVGGGANGAVLANDGGMAVTQNGGMDTSALAGLFDWEPPPVRSAEPGLQRVAADGSVSYLARDGFNAPNDLAVAPDGTLYFTDPGRYPPPEPPIGRVMALDPDGGIRVVGGEFWFCNGIAFDTAGRLVIVEKAGLMRLEPDGGRSWLIQTLGRGGGDGFCFDSDGRAYVASTIEHGVRVIDVDGTEVDFLEIGGRGVTTNCCFGGRNRRDLYATDAVPGRVVVW
ncbi:MAG: SMP-30/gluconolactonase/LRE family protein, partial [Acidimicrobiales bacterium]